MRIAIAGTHCSGKSTLIEEFLLNHSSYKHEPEAYEALQELSSDMFPEPTAESFFAQLEYHVDRLRQYKPGDCVVFERSPLDYVAYLDALSVLRRSTADSHLAKQSVSIVREAVGLLDMIVFLAGSEIGLVSEDEDPELRDVVDTILEDYLVNDSLDLFKGECPSVVQVNGTIAQRLQALELVMTSQEEDT